MVAVTLTERDLRLALTNAGERRLEWLRDGRRERFDGDGLVGLGRDFVGTVGELATAKYLGAFPSGFSSRGAGDVGMVEVRAVAAASHNLLIYQVDPDNRPVVMALVPANPLREPVRLLGWILAGDGKRPEFFHDSDVRRPVFMVPRSALLPMGDLLTIVGRVDSVSL